MEQYLYQFLSSVPWLLAILVLLFRSGKTHIDVYIPINIKSNGSIIDSDDPDAGFEDDDGWHDDDDDDKDTFTDGERYRFKESKN